MRLSDEELKNVLARAEEIERATRRGDEWNAELKAVISAAEEVGLSRQAVERALAERQLIPAPPPSAGSLAWARSADGRYYVAEVLGIDDDGARVRFLSGGEHRLAREEVRSCAFIPGERVTVDWPMWGKWTCSVVSYDAARRKVTVSDGWGETKAFPIDEVWQTDPTAPKPARWRVRATLLTAGATAGAVLSYVLMRLLS